MPSQRYFCVSPAYFNHHKTLRLVDMIKERGFFVPLMFMAYASLNQEDGDFSDTTKYSDEVLLKIFPEAFKSVYDVKKVCESMEKVGFFNPGTRQIHDWEFWNEFHSRRHKAAKVAAEARWKRQKEGYDPAGEGRGTPPPDTPPPPEGKKAPLAGKKILPDQGSNRTQQRSAEPDPSTPPSADKREKITLSEKDKRWKRLDLSRKAKAIQDELEHHIGRPDSTFNFKGDAARAAARLDYKRMKEALSTTNREIAEL